MVLGSLLAAGQGLKYCNVGICQNLPLVQDVAALRVLPDMCREYLEKFGYRDVFQAAVSYQWMSAFPPGEARAFSIISLGGVIPVLGTPLPGYSSEDADQVWSFAGEMGPGLVGKSP